LTPTTTAAALGAAALSTAFLVPTFASAGQQDAATGGGQVNIGTRGGAGDTIAFTAKGAGEDATGQVQYVDREADGQTVLHGTVTCLIVDGTTARMEGKWRDDADGTFGLFVQDNGEGSKASGDDIVALVPNEPMCDEDDGDYNTALARGNAQVRDNTE
jgi:hypothetical protein